MVASSRRQIIDQLRGQQAADEGVARFTPLPNLCNG